LDSHYKVSRRSTWHHPLQGASLRDGEYGLVHRQGLTGQVRGTALFTPLTYVIRKELPPDAQALAKIAEYNNINNNLVATVLLEGPRYKKDNKKLYNLLKTLLIEGSIWPFIQPYNAKTDGRAPWIAITK